MYRQGLCMMFCYENRRGYCVVARRTFDPESLGKGKEPSPASGPARPDYPAGRRWNAKPGCGEGGRCFVSDGSSVATEVSGHSFAGAGERRSPSGPNSPHFRPEGSGDRGGYAPHDASWRDPLEHTDDGPSSRGEPADHSPDMETAPPPAASGGNLQTQPGQTLYRKASRRGRSVSESSGQSCCSVRGREKPDSSAGQNPTPVAPAPWDSRSPDTRLQAQRH